MEKDYRHTLIFFHVFLPHKLQLPENTVPAKAEHRTHPLLYQTTLEKNTVTEASINNRHILCT